MQKKLIDLFSGAGGMSLGFSKGFGHNCIPVFANDNNLFAVKTYNKNFGEHCIHADIVTLLRKGDFSVPQADIVIGGPPCQGFSLLNKNREGDPRKELWQYFMEVVAKSGAKIFVMENVPQLLGSSEFGQIKAKSESMGFNIAASILNSADYGVAQTRRRAFIVGCQFADPGKYFPPLRTFYDPSGNYPALDVNLKRLYVDDPRPWKTVRDMIGDLPDPIGTEIMVGSVPPPLDLHFGRKPTALSLKRYRAIPEEGMNRFDLQRLVPELTPSCWLRKKNGGTDLFGRLWWGRPAFTLRTEFFKPEKGRYLHPEKHRPITHREAARLQSFPDNFIFLGSKIEVAKQIGNAVPPLLASKVAECVDRLFTMFEECSPPQIFALA